MPDQHRGNGHSPDFRFGQIMADLRNLRERQDRHEAQVGKALKRFERALQAQSDSVSQIERSINRAVLYLALGAGAVIFDLLRRGVAF